MGPEDIGEVEVERFYRQLISDAERSGYRLNPDPQFTKRLARGLLVNSKRYGYGSCPCRLASGKKEEDIDIVCPCDYRDPDLGEYGACYCGLYVSEAIHRGEKKFTPVPERREPKFAADSEAPAMAVTAVPPAGAGFSLKYPVWRCRVCGYICARDEPPGACPICKASKDRFERFI